MPSVMHGFRLYAISTILVLSCLCRTYAQPYYFRHFQVENGLSNSTVFCSLQDKNGFLWFGTKEGLNRFDGYHFRLFSRNSQSIGSDMIYCLFSDPSGTLWVGGQNGLFQFDQEQEKLVRVIDSLVEINWIQTDDKGNLWFLCLNNVYRYNLTTHTLKHFPDSKYFFATCICQSEKGEIWFSDNNGHIWKFNEGSEDFTSYDMFSHSPAPSSRWMQRIRYAGNNRFLIATNDQGLKSFDANTGQYKDILTYNADGSTIYVREILQYSDDEFWVATESGIFIMNISTGKVINLRKKFLDPYSLSDNAVYSLCKDSEGGVWAGTYFGGVNYYSKQHAFFEKYYPDNSTTSISGSAVREICQDPYNNIWIGTEDAGLNKLDYKTGAITHFMPTGARTGIAYSNIHGLLAAGNELWVGTFEHGLDVMDVRTGKVMRHYNAGPRPNELKSNFVLTLIKTSSGKIALGSSTGAYWYNEKTNDFTPLPGIPLHIFVAIIVEDHDGVLWLGTHNSGVFYLDPKTGRTGHIEGAATDGKGLSSTIINAITEDNDHNMWFSTEGGGLCRLGADRKTFFSFTTRNGLPSNFIFRLIQDDNNDYWVTTSKGLVNIHKGSYAIKVYTRANGLLNDQFNYNSGFKDKDGKLYFGSVRGMTTFHPNDFVSTGFTPAVYITGFQVDNEELRINPDSSFLKKSIIYTDKITLPYNQSSFSIDFAALSYASPERTEYSYFMQGLDKAWTSLSTNRKVYFTKLAPGSYIFKLKAAVGGHWGQQVKELAIEVLPPFWATTWAYLLYALLVIFLIWYIVRSYHRRTEIKKEKEIYEAKIDFFTNIAHEIRTPLTLIKGPAENLKEKIDQLPEIKEDVVTMERNTNRLIALVTQILDFRQTETKGFSLDFSRVNITAVLQDTWLSFQALAKKKNLHYYFEHPTADVYAMADEEALNKIFSNLFSNAVKYGHEKVFVKLLPPQHVRRTGALKNITHSSERSNNGTSDNEPEVRSGEDGDIILEIANDGPVIPAEMRERIFEPFYRLKETSRQKGTGIGLALARSLVELHKGQLFMDDDWPGMNKFVLVLPARPEPDKIVAKRASLKT